MDDTSNRLLNCSNKHQGKFKKVLTVCSAGLLRSPSIAHILSNPPYNCNTRACGIDPDYALVPIDRVLVEWADEIVCADLKHEMVVSSFVEKCSNPQKKIINLGLPDIYDTRETRLLQIIQEKLNGLNYAGTIGM